MALDTNSYLNGSKPKEETSKSLEDISESMTQKEDETKDTDGDGLSDKVEDSLGTNKYLFDTDGDGIGDGAELIHGKNPLINDMIRNGDVSGLKSSLNTQLDPTSNLLTLRVLSRMDKENRNDYNQQISKLISTNPDLAQAKIKKENDQTSKLFGMETKIKPTKDNNKTKS